MKRTLSIIAILLFACIANWCAIFLPINEYGFISIMAVAVSIVVDSLIIVLVLAPLILNIIDGEN